MNAKIKQTLALVLALVLCLGLLAGCQGNEDPTTKPTTPVVPNPSGSAGASGTNSDIYPLKTDKTLEVYTGSAKLNEKYVSKFWEEVTGVKVNYVTMDTAQQNTALAAKDIPDVWILHSRLTKQKAKEFGDAGLFIDFRDYLHIMPNVKAMFEKYPDALALVQNDDGSIYALPQVGQKGAGNLNPISIRTDMLTAAGWTKAPATTDEFLQCIKDIQAHFSKDDSEFKAFHAYRTSYMNWRSNTHTLMGWFFPAFGELLDTAFSVDKDGKVVFGATTDQFKHTLEYLNQLWTSGAFATTVYEEDGTQFRALLAQKKIAAGFTMTTLTPEYFDSGKIELTVCEPFTSTYYSEKHAVQTPSFTWYNMMISAKCDDIETACKWMDAFYAPKENPLNKEGTIWGISFSLGEYGKHWTVDEEEGTYSLIEVDGITTGNATHMVNLSPGWYEFPYILAGDQTGTEVVSAGVAQNVKPYLEPLSYYNMAALNLNEEESDLYADTWTGINKYISEMTAKFITGELDVNAKWSDYIKELEFLGLKELTDMYQGVYDRQVKK